MLYNDLYSGLFDKRQKGDDNDFFDWTEDDILPLIEPTKAFIETIKALLILKINCFLAKHKSDGTSDATRLQNHFVLRINKKALPNMIFSF